MNTNMGMGDVKQGQDERSAADMDMDKGNVNQGKNEVDPKEDRLTTDIGVDMSIGKQGLDDGPKENQPGTPEIMKVDMVPPPDTSKGVLA